MCLDNTPMQKGMLLTTMLQILLIIIGRVLNRFSKDIGFMDDLLPYHFNDLFTVSKEQSIFNVSLAETSLLLATAEICCYYGCGVCGQLLVNYSCHYYCYGTVIVSMVLLTHIKAYKETRSTW